MLRTVTHPFVDHSPLDLFSHAHSSVSLLLVLVVVDGLLDEPHDPDTGDTLDEDPTALPLLDKDDALSVMMIGSSDASTGTTCDARDASVEVTSSTSTMLLTTLSSMASFQASLLVLRDCDKLGIRQRDSTVKPLHARTISADNSSTRTDTDELLVEKGEASWDVVDTFAPLANDDAVVARE
jgi:hypothetical protein